MIEQILLRFVIAAAVVAAIALIGILAVYIIHLIESWRAK